MLVLKKKWVIVASCILLVVTAGAIALGCVLRPKQVAGSGPITVVIDAGHGGVDAGAVGASGKVKESELNLAVAKCLQKIFAGGGVRAVMTRTDQDGLYGTPTNGFKRRDMEKRKSIIAETKPDLVISVHMNKCNIPSRRGAQVFYSKTSAPAKELAETMQNSLNAGLESPRKYLALTGDYFMLNCSPYPSVIVECGFLSNPAEEALLSTKEYQDKVAYFIYEGAMSYLSQNTSYGKDSEYAV